jgi:hypothetical protein
MYGCSQNSFQKKFALEQLGSFFMCNSSYVCTLYTKKKETKPKPTKPNQTKPNQTKPNQNKPNQIKLNLTKPNQIKPNQTKLAASCTVYRTVLAMSNQHSFKIESFRFSAFVPKKIKYSSLKQNSGSKQNVFYQN